MIATFTFLRQKEKTNKANIYIFFLPQDSNHSVIGNKLFLNTCLHKKIIVP